MFDFYLLFCGPWELCGLQSLGVGTSSAHVVIHMHNRDFCMHGCMAQRDCHPTTLHFTVAHKSNLTKATLLSSPSDSLHLAPKPRLFRYFRPSEQTADPHALRQRKQPTTRPTNALSRHYNSPQATSHQPPFGPFCFHPVPASSRKRSCKPHPPCSPLVATHNVRPFALDSQHLSRSLR